MNEWLKKFADTFKNLWAKWTIIQKVILFGIVSVVLIAFILLLNISAKPTTVRLFSVAITDETARQNIIIRLDQEKIETWVDAQGFISVEDNLTKYRAHAILIEENLVPSNVNSYAFFDQTNWAVNDFQNQVQWQKAMTTLVKQHIEAIEGINFADVSISFPEDKLFLDQQNPVTASVILRVDHGSELLSSRKKLLGIQNLIIKAIEGLTAENLIITDSEGNILNNFADMADSDRIDIVKKQQELIKKLEIDYRLKILKALQAIYTADRVRDLSIKFEMDMSKKSYQSTEYTPIQRKVDNPDTPYDDSETVDSIAISEQTVTKTWKGTGFNPEGPAGVEGQNPPVYSDMSNVIGTSTESGVTKNNAINTKTTQVETSPAIDRVTVSVNIDGKWTTYYDKNHNYIIENGDIKREYSSVSKEELEQVTSYIQNAIGYDRARNYQVTVTNIQVDRTAQFAEEAAAFFKAQQTRNAVLVILGGIVVVLLMFIVFRFISREMERRKRLHEEELLRKQQAAREQALWDAKEEGMEVTMSVEERKRAELQENVIALAKEHPEDVAMLVRTWLMEE